MCWSRRQDSNLLPLRLERSALPATLLAFPPGLERVSADERPLSCPLDDGNAGAGSGIRTRISTLATSCSAVELCRPGFATSQVVKERSASSGRHAGAVRKRKASAVCLVP